MGVGFGPRSVWDMVVRLSKCDLQKTISPYVVILFTFRVNDYFSQLLYKSSNNV